jgi:hypothetical protein
MSPRESRRETDTVLDGRVPARRAARKRDWESICSRCGLCCYVRRLTPSGLHVDTHAPCRFLDARTHLCTVYERRFQVCSDCRKVTILHALFSPYLPETCAYVQIYRPKLTFKRSLAAVSSWLLRGRGAEATTLGARKPQKMAKILHSPPQRLK